MRDVKELIESSKNNSKNKFAELREKFFNFLLKKPCTLKQAEEFLCGLEISEEQKNILLNEAGDMGLADDLTYAKLFIEGHLTWGNMKIIYELSKRGVSRENINAALDDAEDEISRANKILKGWENSFTPADSKKIINRLLNRGFSHKTARTVIEVRR